MTFFDRLLYNLPGILWLLCLIALCLTMQGCVQARLAAYDKPKQQDKCETEIYVDGRPTGCISHSTLMRRAKDIGL